MTFIRLKLEKVKLDFLLFLIPLILLVLVKSPYFLSSGPFDTVIIEFKNYLLLIVDSILISFLVVVLLLPFIQRRKLSFKIDKLFPLVSVILAIIVAFLFLGFHNLLNGKVIIWDDYPIHHLRGWYLRNHLLPNFNSILGFSPYFWAGYPTLHFYSPGFYMIMAFFGSLGMAIPLTIRLFIFLILVFYIVVPFIFCKYLDHSNLAALMASLWASSSIIWLKLLIGGMIPFLFSAITGMIFILLFFKYIDKTGQKNNQLVLLSALLFSFSTLMHFTIAIFLVAALFIFILCQCVWKRVNSAKNTLYFVFVVVSLSFLILSFWVLPTIIAYQSNLNTIESLGLELSNPAWMLVDGIPNLFHSNIIWGFMAIVFLGIAFSFRNKNQKEIFLCILLFASLIFTMIGVRIEAFQVAELGLVRFMVFFEIISSIFVSRFFQELISFLKARNAKSKRLSLSRYHMVNSLYVSIFLIVVLTSLVTTYSHLKDYAPKYVYEKGRFSVVLMENHDYTNLDQSVRNVFSWIRDNTSNKSRVLVEDSGAYTLHFWGGHVLALEPILTGRHFIGGYQPYHWYCWSDLATCKEGEAFNRKFKTMNLTYFVENLERFNVRYLVLWTDDARNFANSFPDNLTLVSTFGAFQIFNFTQTNDSYCWTNSTWAKTRLIEFRPEKIVFEILNASKGDYFRFSLFKYSNYRVYVNTTEAKFIQEEPMMSLIAPENGNFEIKIVWTKSTLETVSMSVSLLSFLLIISYVVFMFVRYVKTKSFEKIDAFT